MKVMRNFFTVCASTLGSRSLGFIRETLIAATLGIGRVSDVFYIAFHLPFLFRRLAAEGVFHNSFIPMFSHEKEKRGSEGAQRLSSEVFSVLILGLVVFSIFIEIILPLLVRFVLAPGFAYQSDMYFLTIKLSRVMFPSIIFMSLASLITGIFFALKHYFIASINPIVLNTGPIFILIYAKWYNFAPHETAYMLAWGVLLTCVVHLWIVFVYAKKYKVRPYLQYPQLTHNVKKFLKLTFPLIITGGIIQINNIVGRAISSSSIGMVSALQYAERVYLLPVGVIGGAMTLAILPELSRSMKSGNKKEIFEIQNQAIECISFFTIPAAIILFMFSKEIIQILYERGSFSVQNTLLVSSILSIYSIGIPGFILARNLQTAFYAQSDMTSPMKFTLIAILINFTIAITSFPFIGGYGIAFAEVSSGWVNTVCLAVTLWKRQQINLSPKTIYRILSIFLSSGLMVIFIMLFKPYFHNNIMTEQTFFNQFTKLIFILSCAFSVYLCAILLFIGKDFLSLLRKAIKK
ncbi:murein biosynthesis integral membrane protein MurJ [Candidatus Liberibacter africanus]|uniref:Probable lipid II flippase MurJ n=1 Tax=Candidatus Liberibacter africanus PTSAPSY TaxID=1277257 RepID=A0A0G3I2L8_LIBAF|nr:murein biosynthesis integral membrane protein MurJ [Candidatus Liberibacter africanus]AKK20134.1 integral membrane protein MviN [Candidatus Liberibacter africanus PTSAPSY]QTP63938.1 murein biosynthesis integral membrane protein MurJ [Candidatus Liberibacter africanus]